jgi:hypothetical protein
MSVEKLISFVFLSLASARAEPVIVITSQHTLIFAQTACKVYQANPEVSALCHSVNDPRALGRNLENEIMSRVAVTPRCKGVTISLLFDPSYDGEVDQPETLALMQKDYWSLLVDYTPVGNRYQWAMFPEPFVFSGGQSISGIKSGDRRAVLGEGTVPQIVEQICTVVTGQGGTIR